MLSKGYSNKDFAIHTLKNNFEADAYFVKVIGKLSLYSQFKWDLERNVDVWGSVYDMDMVMLCVWSF